MRQLFSWLLTIKSSDDDARRRGRNVVILALSVCVMICFLVPLVLSQMSPGMVLVLFGPPTLIYIGAIWLARRGLVTLSALIFIATETVGVFGGMLSTSQIGVAPFFLVLSLLIASLSLRPWQIWPVLAASLAGLIATALLLPNSPLKDMNGYQTVVSSVFLLGIVALVSFLGAKSTSVALNVAHDANNKAQNAASELSRLNSVLETTVAERTAALESALTEVQARADTQSKLLAEVEQQRIAIRELSVPVIPISATTLIMPLVGDLDGSRLQQLQEQALQALQRSSAHFLVLDITGVPMVDTHVAQGLLAVVQAARLLGARVMMVGIRPEVAQSIVALGLNMHGMDTASDLQSALSVIGLN
jgi:rsbT co-antagonist protein RsbR